MTPRPSAQRSCWCGNGALEPFDDAYGRCPACETLVRLDVPADIDRVRSDDSDFYGRDYWYRHQTDDLGAYDVAERARRDLPERCAYWTAELLRRRASPADTLDVGCGHGGFVALLGHLGFRAAGLELSPTIVEFARTTFAIRVDVGRLEDQTDIGSSARDVLIFMDVLEHLPDPLTTMRRAAEIVRPDGLIMLQTPRYPEGTTRADLGENDLFLKMLVPEHLYLFSQTAVRRLFDGIGFRELEFEEPLAAHDMLAFAGRTTIPWADDAEIERLLTSSPSARVVGAVLDSNARVDAELRSLREEHARVATSRDTASAYALDLQTALERTESAAKRHAAGLEEIIAARDAEIVVLKAIVDGAA